MRFMKGEADKHRRGVMIAKTTLETGKEMTGWEKKTLKREGANERDAVQVWRENQGGQQEGEQNSWGKKGQNKAQKAGKHTDAPDS